ncbi:bifunctional 3,4-dihydroxy-2-butanone-4-phosphate synthase/GTP cyclohydrolase II, partial [Candidatus Woesearchaeota archaeon]|nr:bifunctional 3,4-dihydroxy-2-butanone-4-phosphate synthase/GTP cyclohydrolase II [Candidatus Woesearchaeota archaeon]
MDKIRKTAETELPTKYGTFRLLSYEDILGDIHLVLIHGDVKGRKNVYVRVHSQCLTGDAFGSLRCDCGQQLENALKLIAKNGG